MAINEKVHAIGFFADKAFDEKDTSTLKKIVLECFSLIESDEFNLLETGILAYHGATSCSNYITLKYNGVLGYFDEKDNEEDFEMCLLLFRRAIECFTDYRAGQDDLEKEPEEFYYYSRYSLMADTNFAIQLNQCGRLVKALSYLKIGVEQKFPMAVGSLGGFLMDYAAIDYDKNHQSILSNEAYQLLMEALKCEEIHESARGHYKGLIERLKTGYQLDFLAEPYKFDEFSFGESDEEIGYKKWCLELTLFLNTLNDVFPYSAVSHDILHLPNIVTKIDERPRFHGLFNQIKQEYVSARYMVYDALHNRTPHFSDKDVYLVNTLDYPTYGIGIEKMKYAYRSLYSLFDRIAFLVNDYYELGIEDRDVSYRTIWQEKINKGKKSYDLKVNLKKDMTENGTFNLPLVGLYWLCKDIGKVKVEHKYLAPSIERISKIRHHLEHRYLKIHDDFTNLDAGQLEENKNDPLAYSITFDEFEQAIKELLAYAREAIILLSLSINVDQQIKTFLGDPEETIMPMYMDQFDDDWKQIF